VQTFLPLPDFEASARVLDWRRLGKQRSEARGILTTLLFNGGWRHHTAVRMWEGYIAALVEYGNVIIREWVRRGYNNAMPILSVQAFELPPWFGVEAFHASHRSNLLRKLPEHYSQFGWKEGPDLPYFWPTKQGFDGQRDTPACALSKPSQPF
jgi:hypothetical protein